MVTGAAGFLGTRVVDALVRRGHEVRGLVRPASQASLPDSVDVRRADLREPGAADDALEGVDVVVHLAAQVTGSDEARFAGTVVATENLLASMARAGVRRLVLASSYSVYDWSRVGGELDERAPLETEPALYERDGYAVAKAWQERVVRRAADRGELSPTVLRPGYIWGPGNELVDGAGLRLGRVQVVVGPRGTLPLTHVESCADCFAAAVESEEAAGATVNVVDPSPPRTWSYVADVDPGAVRLPVPYGLALAIVRVVHTVARLLLGERMRLPSVFVPRRFEARFKPVRTDRAEQARVLGLPR